jgi:hypothetical protein
MNETELALARGREAERRELAHAMAAVHANARDEEDFVEIWRTLSGHSEDQARRAYLGLIYIWDIEKVVAFIYSFKKTKKVFSVNSLIEVLPGDDYYLAGKAIRQLRGRLEPAGWEVALRPSRKGSGVRTWRFRSDPE